MMEGNTSEINKEEFDALMDELEKRYDGVLEIEQDLSVDDILAMFDENGNQIHDYDDFELVLKDLEERYGQGDEPVDLQKVEEILAMYDDNGNKIENIGTLSEMDEETKDIKKKRYRKRKNKSEHKTEQIQVLHSNTSGYTSKQDCWKDILDKEKPDVVTFNETALKGKRRIKQQNYFSYCKNRDKNMGGVASMVSNDLKQYTTKVGEGKDGDEYNIVRLDHIKPPININQTRTFYKPGAD